MRRSPAGYCILRRHHGPDGHLAMPAAVDHRCIALHIFFYDAFLLR